MILRTDGNHMFFLKIKGSFKLLSKFFQVAYSVTVVYLLIIFLCKSQSLLKVIITLLKSFLFVLSFLFFILNLLQVLQFLIFYIYVQFQRIVLKADVPLIELSERENILNLEIIDIDFIYEEMVTQFLLVEDDPYGPRSPEMRMLTSCILIKKKSILFFVGKTVEPCGAHSVQCEVKKWFYKMLESWFYTIFTMKALGRKEIVKNVQQVSLNLFISKFIIICIKYYINKQWNTCVPQISIVVQFHKKYLLCSWFLANLVVLAIL